MYINNIYNQERLELMQFLLIPFCIDSQVFIWCCLGHWWEDYFSTIERGWRI